MKHVEKLLSIQLQFVPYDIFCDLSIFLCLQINMKITYIKESEFNCSLNLFRSEWKLVKLVKENLVP